MNFKTTAQEEEFSAKGFLKITQFLNDEQMEQLQLLYKDSKLNNTKGKMYSNIENGSLEESLYIENKILEICNEPIQRYFEKYKVAGASFLIKGVGKDSDSHLHQDWNMVDETKNKSLVIWIPLINVDERNGCLQVLSGSHKWFNSIRSSNIDSIHLKFDYRLNYFLEALILNIKDVAVYSINVFHGSKQNTSAIDRPAVAISLMDDSSDFIHYVRAEDDKVYMVENSNKFIYQNYFLLHNNQSEVLPISKIKEIHNINKYIVSASAFYLKMYKEKLFSLWKR